MVEDNDGGVTVVGSPVALTEGGSAGSYTIALDTAPSANVTVTVTSGDVAAVTVSTSNTDNKLTFMTDSYGAKTVTVTPVNDDGDGSDESVTLSALDAVTDDHAQFQHGRLRPSDWQRDGESATVVPTRDDGGG